MLYHFARLRLPRNQWSQRPQTPGQRTIRDFLLMEMPVRRDPAGRCAAGTISRGLFAALSKDQLQFTRTNDRYRLQERQCLSALQAQREHVWLLSTRAGHQLHYADD